MCSRTTIKLSSVDRSTVTKRLGPLVYNTAFEVLPVRIEIY